MLVRHIQFPNSSLNTLYMDIHDEELWSIPFQLSNNLIGSFPLALHVFDPLALHVFDPTTKTVTNIIKYPSENNLQWIQATYREKTKHIFILNQIGDVFRINANKFDQWEKMVEFKQNQFDDEQMSSANTTRRLFIKHGQCYIVGYTFLDTWVPHRSCRFKLIQINEEKKKAEEICISEPIKSLEWNSVPLSLNNSNDIIIISNGDKYLQLLRFVVKKGSNGFGSIHSIKLNDEEKLFDYTAVLCGQIKLRDDLILLFEKIDQPNQQCINIVDIKKGTITKSLIISSHQRIHPVLMEDQDKEEVLVNGYIRQYIQDEVDWYKFPINVTKIIAVQYYCNEKVLFLERCTDKRIRYAISAVDDILQSNANFIDKTKKELKFETILLTNID